jgi:formylglycine-generating enzyme required for sulfatase activity
LSLAEQKLDELQVEQLLASARAKKAQLDAPGAIADFRAAAEAAQARGSTLDAAPEISDTLRYVATQLVQEGEKVLCEAQNGQAPQCGVLVTGAGRDGAAAIGLDYLSWARETAPEMRGWGAYTETLRQQAVITASALFSQALALTPPANTAVYVWIAPGTFEMGSDAEDCIAPGFGECPQNEQPQHTVALDGYWLQRTAVTNEQYGRCVQAGVCKPPANSYWQVQSSARLPVTDVSWAKASQYAALVGGRLPTEAEWEYGCRGGDGRMYPWGDEPAEAPRLNYYNEYGRTIDVGSYAPGANGLYDMAGNVWEWTADWYGAAYYAESPARNPTGPAAETGLRPLRGGSWRNDGNLVRCAYRDDDDPANKYYNVGLRVVMP